MLAWEGVARRCESSGGCWGGRDTLWWKQAWWPHTHHVDLALIGRCSALCPYSSVLHVSQNWSHPQRPTAASPKLQGPMGGSCPVPAMAYDCNCDGDGGYDCDISGLRQGFICVGDVWWQRNGMHEVSEPWEGAEAADVPPLDRLIGGTRNGPETAEALLRSTNRTLAVAYSLCHGRTQCTYSTPM